MIHINIINLGNILENFKFNVKELKIKNFRNNVFVFMTNLSH